MITHTSLPNFTLIEKLEFARFYLNKEKTVILVKYLDNVLIELQRAKQVVEIIYPYVKEGAVYGITDATSSHININAEARLYYKNNKSVAISVAHAVVVKDLYVRLLAQMFIRFDQPIVPTKIFNNFQKAYAQLIHLSELNSSNVPSV